jgi:YHS domain-containing protein
MTARLSRNIVPQSYQKPSDSNEATAMVQSELQTDASSNELRRDAPPVGVDGFCPVELSLHGRWVQGDPRWTMVYKGFIYRLSGNAQRQEFMANPEKFIPGNGGFDPVISFAEKQNVPGQINFCAAYKGRIYMFSSAATQGNFHNNPELYVGGAMK